MAANNTRRLAGIASITIDGSNYDLVGDLEYSVSSVKRETLLGQSGIQGYSEMPVAGHIKAKLRDNGGITVANFNQMTASTVQIVLANSKSVIGSGMWAIEAQSVQTQEGVFEVTFESDNVVEMPI